MAGIVPVFIFLDEASICAFLDKASDLVDLVLLGGVLTPSSHRPSNSGLSLRSMWTSFLQDRRVGNAPKN